MSGGGFTLGARVDGMVFVWLFAAAWGGGCCVVVEEEEEDAPWVSWFDGVGWGGSTAMSVRRLSRFLYWLLVCWREGRWADGEVRSRFKMLSNGFGTVRG